jgi:hypothetical protein
MKYFEMKKSLLAIVFPGVYSHKIGTHHTSFIINR